MNIETWKKIQSIFHDAIDLPERERESFLRAAAAEDEYAVVEAEAYIKAYEKGADLLDQPVLEIDRTILPDDETIADGPSLAGRTIGEFRIGQRIGKGGMGDVYFAEEMSLNQPFALKFISPQLDHDASAGNQLRREAKSVALLHHPNVCQVHHFKEADGHQFIVMEFVEGESLATLVRDKLITQTNALRFGIQVVNAIAAAHILGLIHCDIKPGNVMVTADGVAKVLDFGLAKVVHDSSRPRSAADQITQAQQKEQVLGTVAYMSPEQHLGRGLDYRTDVFSLGTLLYELASGEHPFDRGALPDTKEAILKGDVSFNGSFSSRVSPGLKRIIKKCLENDRDKRYRNAAELLAVIELIDGSWFRTAVQRFA